MPVIDLDLDLALFGKVSSLVVLGYDTWGKLGLHENPNRKAETPHLDDNLVIIKDPKRTRACL